MLVAVAPDKMRKGLDVSKGQLEAEHAYEVTHVDAMLSTTYRTDAHFVAYVVEGWATQPRINKGGLGLVEARGGVVRLACMVADVDNPNHGAWRSDEDAIAGCERMAAQVPTAIVYATRGGARIVQPLAVLLAIDAAEPAIGAWLRELGERGIVADEKCMDWTRHFRCPHVMRDGKPYRSPFVERRSTPIAAPRGISIARRRRGGSGASGPIAFARELPADLERVARALGDDVRRAFVPGQRHDIALVLPAALCRRGVRPELVPALIGRIFEGREEQAECLRMAEETVRRYVGGYGLKNDLSPWPGMARAVSEALGGIVAAPRDRVQVTQGEDRAEAVARAGRQLAEVIRRPGDGCTLVRAQCGLGKTRAARIVAAERAAREGKRHTRTAISVPTHALAIQVVGDLRAAGVASARIFGPLSARDEQGRWICKYRKQGAALAAGGLSVAKILCRGCDHRDTCSARDGIDGEPSAPVLVGPHGLVGELDGMVGTTGLLVIDEPPELLQVEPVTPGELHAALDTLRSPDRWCRDGYTECMSAVLDAVIRWVESTTPTDDPRAAGAIVEHLRDVDGALEAAAVERSGELDAAGWARAAMGDETGETIPIRDAARFRLRVDVDSARRVGAMARVLGLVRRAVLDSGDVSASVEQIAHRGAQDDAPPRRALVLAASDRRMHAALRRDGSVVVLAADADVIRPSVTRVVGYAPRLEAVAAPECTVRRRMIADRHATRSGWMPGGQIDWSRVRAALDAAIAWWCEGPRERALAIVSFKTIVAELQEPRSDAAAWLRARLRQLGPRGSDRVALAWYGQLRGLDSWRELDELASLGDPTPNIGAVAREAAWVARGEASVTAPDDWARMRAAAELEQVHGRLRTVHRTRPARQLHVGRVVPAGWPQDVEIVEPGSGGPLSASEALRGHVERLGGPYAAARALGVEPRTVLRWQSGERTPPPGTLLRLVALASASLGG